MIDCNKCKYGYDSNGCLDPVCGMKCDSCGSEYKGRVCDVCGYDKYKQLIGDNE